MGMRHPETAKTTENTRQNDIILTFWRQFFSRLVLFLYTDIPSVKIFQTLLQNKALHGCTVSSA